MSNPELQTAMSSWGLWIWSSLYMLYKNKIPKCFVCYASNTLKSWLQTPSQLTFIRMYIYVRGFTASGIKSNH